MNKQDFNRIAEDRSQLEKFANETVDGVNNATPKVYVFEDYMDWESSQSISISEEVYNQVAASDLVVIKRNDVANSSVILLQKCNEDEPNHAYMFSCAINFDNMKNFTLVMKCFFVYGSAVINFFKTDVGTALYKHTIAFKNVSYADTKIEIISPRKTAVTSFDDLKTMARESLKIYLGSGYGSLQDPWTTIIDQNYEVPSGMSIPYKNLLIISNSKIGIKNLSSYALSADLSTGEVTPTLTYTETGDPATQFTDTVTEL